MIDTELKLRKMHINDIQAGLRLSSAEKWNQTVWDWKLMVDNSTNVCLVAEIRGEVVGTTTAVNYDNQIAWIAMVLIDREYRGLGISRMLLQETMAGLIPTNTIKLDATPAGMPVYRKLGFNEEYKIHRMTRLPGGDRIFNQEEAFVPVPMHPEYLKEVVRMDSIVFGANREKIVGEMIKTYPDISWVLMQGSEVTGFVLGRRGSLYTQIGPVCAQTDLAARALISAAFTRLQDTPVVVDIPESKSSLFRWLESKGFVSQRLFTRMYLDDNPYPGIEANRFLICGPEFG